jgi:hypothetical protein
MKTSTLSAFLTSAVFAIGTLASAQLDPSKDEFAWNYSTNIFVSKDYFGTIIGSTIYPGRMSFTDFVARRVDAKGSTGFDLSIGQKLDSFSYNKDGGNEYDFTVDRSMTFNSKSFPVRVDAAVCYLAVYDLRQMRDDSISADVRFDLPKTPFIQPYVVIYRFDHVGNVAGSGWFFYGGFVRKEPLGWQMNNEPLEWNFEYRLGYSEKLYGTKPGLAYHRFSLSLPIEIFPRWTFTPGVVEQLKGNQPKGYAFASSNQKFWTVSLGHRF